MSINNLSLFLLIIAFKISYIETNNHRYIVHKDFTWKPKWEKTTEHFLIYQKITSTGSTDFQDSPAPTGRRHRPPKFSSIN